MTCTDTRMVESRRGPQMVGANPTSDATPRRGPADPRRPQPREGGRPLTARSAPARPGVAPGQDRAGEARFGEPRAGEDRLGKAGSVKPRRTEAKAPAGNPGHGGPVRQWPGGTCGGARATATRQPRPTPWSPARQPAIRACAARSSGSRCPSCTPSAMRNPAPRGSRTTASATRTNGPGRERSLVPLPAHWCTLLVDWCSARWGEESARTLGACRSTARAACPVRTNMRSAATDGPGSQDRC